MTREIAKELLPIIKAYSEGKQVQYFNGKYWEDMEYLNFDSEPHRYRIKPEIKYRPFKSVEECFNEIIVKICEIRDDLGLIEYEIGMAALDGKDMPQRYINDDILIEYYSGIKYGKTPAQMREVCLPKYIRRELNKNLI